MNADGFYLSSGVENGFANKTLQGEHPQDKSLCSKTTLTYDSYYLTTKKQTQYLNDSVSLGTEVLTDYITTPQTTY